MAERRRAEITISNVEAGIGLAQSLDNGGRHLAGDRSGALNAGIDMQELHG